MRTLETLIPSLQLTPRQLDTFTDIVAGVAEDTWNLWQKNMDRTTEAWLMWMGGKYTVLAELVDYAHKEGEKNEHTNTCSSLR